MVTLIPKSGFLFGIVESKPTLPEGFEFVEAADSFLMATGPDGREWFVQEKRLVRCGRGGDDKDNSGGKLKQGAKYCDDREMIDL